MKKIKLIFPLFILMVSSYSCNDNYLDEVTYGQLDDSVLWKDKSDFQQALNSAISRMDQPWGYSTVSFLIMEDGATDYWIGGGGSYECGNFSAWKTNYPSFFSWAVWSPLWESIYYSNLVLERLDRLPHETDAQKEDVKRFEGQARFYRALNYYFAQNKFGDVPIVTSVADTRANIPQSSREEVRKLIENDLIIAASLLPGKADVKAEGLLSRPSKQAALGLLARLYINWESRADRWQKTSDACDSVINDASGLGLEFPYSKIFALDNENNKEIVYAIEHSTVSVTTGFSLLNTEFAVEWNMKTPTASMLRWGDWRVTRDFYDKTFDEPNDVRKNQILTSYINTNGISTNITYGALVAKYPLDSYNLYNAAGGNDQPLIRYADIILMKAEAQNHLGNLAVAIGLVNQIRNRAGLDNLTSPDKDSETSLNDYIYKERRREFFDEGLGRTDMIRFKKFLKWVNEKNGGDKNIDADSKYLVYPFDGLALRKNTGLIQNIGFTN